YPATVGQWYHIEMRNINFTAHTFDIYINNVLQYTSFPFRSATQNSISRLHLYNFNNGVGVWDNITIGGGIPIVLSSTPTNLTCPSGNTGAVDLAVSGGNPGFTYAWNNSATTQDISGLTAGSYSVTVTDAIGCTATHSVTLTEPPAFNMSSVGTDALCNGTSTGSINLSVSGATPGYSFLWSNSAATEDVSGLASGTYSVVVTDANNCTSSLTGITINEPPAVTASITSTDVLCAGGNSGMASVAASGGVGSFTYLWTPSNATNDSISGLSIGTYTCVVTDGNGCSNTQTVTLSEPTALFATTSFSMVSCNGGNNGSGAFLVGGGTPAYTYLWSNGDTTASLSSLSAGTYSCTATDANGCTILDSLIINEPLPLLSFTNNTVVSCNGACDGTAFINVTGGTMPYTYLWTNNATNDTINGLCAGMYFCTVTDSNGCVQMDSALVTEPDVLGLSGIASNTTMCSGTDGAVDLSVTGGSPFYTFSWSNQAATEDVFNLGAGSYAVSVVDANGCMDSISFIILDPLPPIVTVALDRDSICTNDAILALTGGSPAGGSWSGPGVTGSSFDPSSLAQGFTTITYTYTDPNTNCTASNTDVLYVSLCTGIASQSVSGEWNIFPNPASNLLTISYASNTQPVQVVLFNALGEQVGFWNMNSDRMDIDVTNLAAGIYVVQINRDGATTVSRIIKE
ncbi:MAG: T9SS type A sorting domain-containing protein, partial [Bacteroidia bacterium]